MKKKKFRSDFYYERECHFYEKDLDLIFIIWKNDALGEKDSNMIFITWKTMNWWKIFRSDFYNMKNNEFKR